MHDLLRNRAGLTLVEILIVVVVVGILSAVAVPKLTDGTNDARRATLDTSLSHLRGAVELYRLQHQGQYPGARHATTGAAVSTRTQASAAFEAQLTGYTNIGGRVSSTKSAEFRFGPYLRGGLPVNPYNEERGVNCDIVTTDVSEATPNGAAGTGWRFYVRTGRLIPNHTGGSFEEPAEPVLPAG